MPYKVPQSQKRLRMAKEAAAKYSQLLQLQHNQRRLNNQHDVLTQCCDMLQWLRLQQLPCGTHMAASEPDWAVDRAADACYFQLDHDEQQLLAQLRNLSPLGTALDVNDDDPAISSTLSHSSKSSMGSCSNGSSQYSLAAPKHQHQLPAGHHAYEQDAVEPHGDTLSPVGDLMYLFKSLITQPPYPTAATMTLEELQDDYATTVCELSINLTALQDPQLRASLQEPPLVAIHRVVLRHYHMLCSMLLHRDSLLMAFYTSNCLTGEVQEQELKSHIDRALLQLNLSTCQQQLIGESMAVFKRLLAPVLQARHQLQCEGLNGPDAEDSTTPHRPAGYPISAAVAGSSTAVHTDHGEGDVCSSEASSDGVDIETQLLRSPSLQQQEKKVLNLRTLMKKEVFLRALCICTILGSLTALQVAQLMVDMFPHPAPMNKIAQEIAQRWEVQENEKLAAALAATCISSSCRTKSKNRRRVGVSGSGRR